MEPDENSNHDSRLSLPIPATPTLVRPLPKPVRNLIFSLSNLEIPLIGLDLRPAYQPE